MISLPYKLAAGAALMLALFGAGYWQGYRHEHAAWDAADTLREAEESAAIIKRQADNARAAQRQAESAATIQRVHDEELASVRADLAAAVRMRRPAFCGGTAAPAQAESPTSGPAADSAGGVLPQAVAYDIHALILQTEEVAATARSCQAFVRANGMD